MKKFKDEKKDIQTETFKAIDLILKKSRKDWKWLHNWLVDKKGKEKSQELINSYGNICGAIAHLQEAYKLLIIDLSQHLFSYKESDKKIGEIVILHTTKSINQWILKELI